MKDPFIQRLTQLAKADPRIFLIVGDLGFGMIEPFVAQFPKQFLNAGVAEQNMTGIATGLALEGHIVYTYSIGNFSTLRCLEQIRNDASYHDANVKVVCLGGGFSYGALGISHHATEDISVMRSQPGVKVLSPGDNWEAAEATEAAARTPGTVYLRLDKSTAPDTHAPGEIFHFGRARKIEEGKDLTFISTGGILGEVLKASKALREIGITCRVLNLHTIKPIDTSALVKAAKETGGIITVEEHMVDGGLGSAVAEVLMDEGAHPKFFRRIGLRGGFSSVVGSQSYLRTYYGLDANALVAAAKSLVPADKGEAESVDLPQNRTRPAVGPLHAERQHEEPA